jgi:outer membrane protein TolC
MASSDAERRTNMRGIADPIGTRELRRPDRWPPSGRRPGGAALRAAGMACCLLAGGNAMAQPSDTRQPAEAPAVEVLTLDQAAERALKKNRQIEIAELQLRSARRELAAIRASRYPSFGVGLLGSRRLITQTPGIVKDLTTILPLGPIPSILTSGDATTAFLVGAISQQITGLRKIALQARLQEAKVEAAQEDLRRQEQAVVAQVKQGYYGFLQAQSSLDAIEESLRYYRELERTVADNVQQQTALKADLLDVRARLASQEHDALTARQQLASGQEQLNYLMGRDVRAPFRVAAVPEAPPAQEDLAALQALALKQRPEMRQAALQVTQARVNRHLAQAEYTPHLSVGLTYLRPHNISVLPDNMLSLDLQFLWEPYDWGRRKQEVLARTLAVQQSERSQDDTEAQVLMDVSARFRSLEAARDLMRASQASQEAARERARVAADRYAQQAALLKDVLQAQASLADANRQYQQALLSYLTALGNLSLAIGER